MEEIERRANAMMGEIIAQRNSALDRCAMLAFYYLVAIFFGLQEGCPFVGVGGICLYFAFEYIHVAVGVLYL